MDSKNGDRLYHGTRSKTLFDVVGDLDLSGKGKLIDLDSFIEMIEKRKE